VLGSLSSLLLVLLRMEPTFIRPPVQEVVYRLFTRPVHPEFFDTLALMRLPLVNGSLAVRITPTGHVLEWHSGKASFVEVTATAEHELPPTENGLCFPFLNARRGKLARSGWLFQVGLQREQVPEEAFEQVHEELLAESRKPGAVYASSRTKSKFPALGLVCVSPLTNGLSVVSFHTYPEEHSVIKTQSLIETDSANITPEKA
jgi:hypothetical protein